MVWGWLLLQAQRCHAARADCSMLPCSQLPLNFLAQFASDEHGELEVLGAGSHAVVYLGLLNGRHVAVKVPLNWCVWAVDWQGGGRGAAVNLGTSS